MNIFYLDKDPHNAPKFLYNKHVVKMILETAQILCTAHQVLAEEHGYCNKYIPYRKAYYNHPSCIWARQSQANYMWLWSYFVGINMEYNRRYNNVHASWVKLKNANMQIAPKHITQMPFTQPPQCMPEEFHSKCSVKAYWKYYINDKKHIAHKNEVLHITQPPRYATFGY